MSYFTSEEDFKSQFEHDIEWTKVQIKNIDDRIKELQGGRFKNTLDPEAIKVTLESSEEVKKGHMERLEKWQEMYKQRYGQMKPKLKVIQGGGELKMKKSMHPRGKNRITGKGSMMAIKGAGKVDDGLSQEFRAFLHRERGGTDQHADSQP